MKINKEHKKIIDLYEKCIKLRKKEMVHKEQTGSLRIDDNGMTKDSNIFAEFGSNVYLVMMGRLDNEIVNDTIIKSITKQRSKHNDKNKN